jgi:hypothetical protein
MNPKWKLGMLFLLHRPARRVSMGKEAQGGWSAYG